MKNKKIFMNRLVIYLSLTFLIFVFSCKEKSVSQVETSYIPTFEAKPGMEVIQFHMIHRCKTCVAIEDVTKKTIQPYDNLVFKLINIEEPENDSLARSFRVAGTALFLYDPASGKKEDLTDFAFMTAFDEEKFIKGLQKEIEEF